MAELEKLGNVIETDVLVIGGGVAGLWAAKKAREAGQVTIVDKGPIGYTSQAYFAQAGQAGALPGEDIEAWIKEIVYLGDGLVEQDMVEIVLRQSYDRIRDYEDFGVNFRKYPDGSYHLLTRLGGQDHLAAFITDPVGFGGKAMIKALFGEVQKLGVQLVSKVCITNLVIRDGRVSGAVGFNIRDGQFYTFKARAVVLASGDCTFKGQSAMNRFATGDGIAMAYAAGAELRNMEFPQMWVIMRGRLWDGLAFLLPAGGRFVNAQNEEFMEKYAPQLGCNIAFNYLVRGMALEARAGRGPFYFDPTRIDPAVLGDFEHYSGWMGSNVKKLIAAGEKVFTEPQEWEVAALKLMGISTDTEMQTRVPGLFVGGRLRSIDPGIRFGGWSLATAVAFGYRAGEYAARYAAANEPVEISAGEVAALREGVFAPLGKVGMEPQYVLTELQKAYFQVGVLVLKSQSSLEAALARIVEIRDELLPRMGARDLHYLMNLREVMSMTLITELSVRASLARTESCAAHYREDYPGRDDENWLKWILLSCREGKASLRTEPVPLDRYRVKPSQYYMDNFVFPE
ncbi:MAG: FAD-binding protein [Chloroflexota bacterium]